MKVWLPSSVSNPENITFQHWQLEQNATVTLVDVLLQNLKYQNEI